LTAKAGLFAPGELKLFQSFNPVCGPFSLDMAMNQSETEPILVDPYRWPIRVYYEDTDAAGVVYYANYLKYFERARTEWLRSFGFEQKTLARDYNVIFVVRALSVQYLRPAQFDDELTVELAVAEQPRASILFKQAVKRRHETLASAEVRVTCVNTQTFKPVRIPAAILERIAVRQA
jgi:acyl-CoA thioester hydrolase